MTPEECARKIVSSIVNEQEQHYVEVYVPGVVCLINQTIHEICRRVIAEEREACAEVADEVGNLEMYDEGELDGFSPDAYTGYCFGAVAVAKAIRARSK